MKVVLSFSPTSGTKRIAEYASAYLNIPLIDITSYKSQKDFDYSVNYDYIVFCFPVFSQNIPDPVKSIITKLKSKYFLFLVSYGRMKTGNVLYEISKLQKGLVIGGAYIPTKHTYKEGNYFSDLEKLDHLLSRVSNNKVKNVVFPKLPKNLLANIFPNYRSRIGVKLKKTNNCTDCGLCNQVCPTNSCFNGLINRNCIRCLSCFYNCPHNGLKVSYSRFLKMYLKKDKTSVILIF